MGTSLDFSQTSYLDPHTPPQQNDCEQSRLGYLSYLGCLRGIQTPALVLILSLLILLPTLNSSLVFQVSEAREGTVVQSIIRDQNFILPLRHAEIVPSKPILFHWIGLGVASALGRYAEFALRFPSALAAALLVTALYVFVQSLGASSSESALASALLVTMYGFQRLARDGRVDMLFCLFLSLVMLIWISALVQSSTISRIPSRTYWFCGLFSGLACLTKGPLGLVLPALVITVITIQLEGFKSLKLWLRRGWILAIGIPLLWYLPASIKGEGAFVSRQIIFENITRFFGGEGISDKPFWFYLPHIWMQAAPWSVLYFVLVGALVLDWILIKLRKDGEISSYMTYSHSWLEADSGLNLASQDSVNAREKRKLALRCLMIWGIVVLSFLSLSEGKRRGYLLLVLPVLASILALVTGRLWNSAGVRICKVFRSRCDHKNLVKNFIHIQATLFLILLSIFLFSDQIGLAFDSSATRIASVNKALSQVIQANGNLLAVYLFLLFPLSVWVIVVGLKSQETKAIAIGSILWIQCGYGLVVDTALATKGITHSYRDFALEVEQALPPHELVHFIKTRTDESFDGFVFYLPRLVRLHDPKRPLTESGYYLARVNVAEELAPGFSPIIRGGRMVDKPDNQVILFRLD